VRQVGGDTQEREAEAEAVVGEDREVEKAPAGEDAEDAVREVGGAEEDQEDPRGAVRDQPRDQRPEGGGKVQRVVERVEREDAEGEAVGRRSGRGCS
jgi:hypothetical protein